MDAKRREEAMTAKPSLTWYGLATFACLISANALADQLPTKEGVKELAVPQFSPYVGRDFPTRVLWGDTHPAYRRLG